MIHTVNFASQHVTMKTYGQEFTFEILLNNNEIKVSNNLLYIYTLT